VKKTLGTIFLTFMISTPAVADSSSAPELAPKAERKVVRIVVKDKKVKANYRITDSKHIKRVFGSQVAAAKVIKPTEKSGGMPNLFKE